MDTPNTPPNPKPVIAPGKQARPKRLIDQSATPEPPAGPGGVVDRRMWPDRRENMAVRQEGHTGLERRRGVGRRLSDFTKSAEEGELTKEQFLFLMAMEAFKTANDRQFPTWMDVLEVIRLLGYRKTMPSELNLRNTEDWREVSDGPASVRPQRWHERAAKAQNAAPPTLPDSERDAA